MQLSAYASTAQAKQDLVVKDLKDHLEGMVGRPYQPRPLYVGNVAVFDIVSTIERVLLGLNDGATLRGL